MSVESLLKPSEARAARSSLPDPRFEDLLETNRYDEVVELARGTLDSDDTAALTRAVAHHYLGQALCHLVRPDEALDHLRRARGLAEATGDPWLAAESLEWEASAVHAKDDMAAVAIGKEALDRYRALEPRRPETEARMLERLATFLVRRRAYDQAEHYYELALEVAGPVRDLTRVARIYHGLSHCHWTRGDTRRGIDLAQMAVSLYTVESQFRPFAAKISLPRAENDLGTMLVRQGQLERAEDSLTSALNRFAASEEDPARGQVLLSLAELRVRQDRQGDALRLLMDASEAGLDEWREACLAAFERMQEARAGRAGLRLRTS